VAQEILDMGGRKPPRLLHHVIKSSNDPDMATWLITIGYDVESLDEVSNHIFIVL